MMGKPFNNSNCMESLYAAGNICIIKAEAESNTHRDKVVLFGGNPPYGVLNDTWEYDGSNWEQVTTSDLPEPRAAGQMAYFASDYAAMLLGGGAAGVSYADLWFLNTCGGATPVADAGGPYAVDEGGSVSLNASGSDPDGDALTYGWDLDDDTPAEECPTDLSRRAGLRRYFVALAF